MKKQISAYALLAIASASLMISCSKETDLYDSNVASEGYNKNWTETYGQVAADQDWNLATQATANVTVDGTADVTVYTKDLDKTYVLANYTISGSKTIKFDAPKNLKEVYIVGIGTDGKRQTAIASVSSNMNVTLESAEVTTKAATRSVPDLQARQFVYAVGMNLFAGSPMRENKNYGDYLNMSGMKVYHNYYSAWNCNVYATQLWGYGNHENNWGSYGDDVLKNCGDKVELTTSSIADIVEGCKNMYVADDDKIEKLYPYTQNFSIVTKGDGKPITLTGIYRNTNGSTALAYFYTPKGSDLATWKAADKYILIPNTANIEGQQFKLVYYDPDNNYEPSYNFPAGLEIHFALVCNADCKYKSFDWTSEKNNICYNLMDGNLWEFSDDALNEDVYKNAIFGSKYSAWTNMSSAALYKYHGTKILSFEDWGGNFTVENGVPTPSGTNSIDWNDIAFIVDADVDESKIEEIDKTTDTEQSWIVACEDLGSDDDTDFNDIVFKVTHVSGSGTATITPLAAGGTLKAEIYSGETRVGEIHELLGNSTTDAEGNYSMLNTSNAKSGYYVVDLTTLPYKADAKDVTLGVDKDNFTMSNVAGGNNMGGFKIKVTKSGTTTDAVTINAPTTGSIPQMLCIPDLDWAWPTERTKIHVAYPEFNDWVGNTSNTEWYKSPATTSSSSAE